jgi:hypothetical protein
MHQLRLQYLLVDIDVAAAVVAGYGHGGGWLLVRIGAQALGGRKRLGGDWSLGLVPDHIKIKEVRTNPNQINPS